VSVSGYLIGSQAAGKLPLPPEAELQWWYQYYFATERGRAGYEAYTQDFAKLIWLTASPKWSFDDATFERTAASFDNPDHVEIVIHNYRWRLGLAEGEAEFDELEKRLAGAGHHRAGDHARGRCQPAHRTPEPKCHATKFAVPAIRTWTIEGGAGHNLPQEAPAAFADAILALAGSS
jgi:pimeloyl-ACP methyl ester carboxylesterase